jgi:subtilisin family serine protease
MNIRFLCRPLAGMLLLVLLLSSSLLAEQPRLMPDRWIVELEDAPTLKYQGPVAALSSSGPVRPGPALAATAPSGIDDSRFNAGARHVVEYASYLDDRRRAALAEASERIGRQIEPLNVYRHVSHGFSAVMNAEEAARLAGMPGVRSVRPVAIHRLQLSEGPELIGARNLASGAAGVPAATGQGVVVGIIDSGINWNHQYFSDDPSVGGHSYTNPYSSYRGLCSNPDVDCNDKLVGVFDFTTEGTLGLDTGGHGTHVASIAAGVEWSSGIGGVAPHAHIISYKVCYESLPDDPDEGGCTGNAIMAALEQAVVDGVDVVNYSIGLSGGANPWESALPFMNLVDAGITFVAAAGNDGPDFGTMNYPADAPWVFAVGSSTHKRRTGRRINISGVGAWFIQYGTGPAPPLPPITGAPLVPGDSVSSSLLGCSPFPANAFADSVALLERGDCNFSVKVDHAASAGALAVVMINNVSGDPITMGGLENTTIPSGMISQVDGQEILDAIAQAGTLNLNMPTADQNVVSESHQDQISSFSSRGPSAEVPNLVKPNVVAPGQNILAGYVPGQFTNSRLNGTSMASPHVTGAVAQLRQLYPSWTPAMLRSALETTAEAEPVKFLGAPAIIMDRGAGRIRVDLAARAGLHLPVSSQQFLAANPGNGGDPANLNLPSTMLEDCAEPCSLTRTVQAIQAGSWTVGTVGDLDIEVTPTSFTLQAGQQQVLEISISAGATEFGNLGEGRVVLTPSGNQLVEQSLTIAAVMVDGGDQVPSQPWHISYPANSSTGSYTVSWSESTHVDSFQLQRSTDGGDSWMPIYEGAAMSRSEQVGNGSYRYRVRACNELDCSDWRTGTGDIVVNIPNGLTIDQPTDSVLLPTDPAQACPGFYIVRTHPGPNSQSGRFGVELLLQGSGSRTLQGGLNFGGRATADVRGFSAFNITNSTGEPQIISLEVNVGAPGQLLLQRRSGGQVVATPVDQEIPAGESIVEVVVPPGFYVVAYAPQVSGSAYYLISALTSFVDRPGGGFQGGAVFGGYHDVERESTGFAGFCIARPFDVSVEVLSAPTYGASGAKDMEFTLSSGSGRVYLARP